MNKKRSGTPSKDDVERLIRGRPSPGRVGSRGIRHRLRLYELKKLQVAQQKGELRVDASTRQALVNAWALWCEAQGCACVIVSDRADEPLSSEKAQKG